ncbi:MAG: nitrogenase [Synechococcaceae cyanobacterium RL_1_2]|nr:nitrogenase [Synechococcaceae cyanobacterium RL_1_2]
MFNISQLTNSLIFSIKRLPKITFTEFKVLRQWLNELELKNITFAHLICTIVPTQCPFARDITLFGRTFFRIPPLCKLNPFYDEIVHLRFRALCYLAEGCHEDISRYC